MFFYNMTRLPQARRRPRLSQVRRPRLSQVRRPRLSQVRRPRLSQVRRPRLSQVRRPRLSQVRRPRGKPTHRPWLSQVRRPRGSQPAVHGSLKHTAVHGSLKSAVHGESQPAVRSSLKSVGKANTLSAAPSSLAVHGESQPWLRPAADSSRRPPASSSGSSPHITARSALPCPRSHGFFCLVVPTGTFTFILSCRSCPRRLICLLDVEAVAEGPCEGPWLLVMPRGSLSFQA